jgi:hypothetical protein
MLIIPRRQVLVLIFQIIVERQHGFLQGFISPGQFGNNIGLGEPGFKKFHGFTCKLAVSYALT